MKAKKAELKFYVPIRLALDQNQRWFSISEARISLDSCRMAIDEHRQRSPFWDKSNPVQHIVQQTIKED